MTVTELIEKLRRLPADKLTAQVYLDDNEWGDLTVDGVGVDGEDVRLFHKGSGLEEHVDIEAGQCP